MYKVFINGKSIFLSDSMDSIREGMNIKVLKYESVKTVKEALGILNNTPGMTEILICHNNLAELWKKFKSYFTIIEAAGGLVKNQKSEILFIFRLQKWDLPKGKIEPGETVESAAIREVEEECGVTGLKVLNELPPTYHIYELRSEIILKKTHWFEMYCEVDCELTPQTEEGITEAKWLDKHGVAEVLKNTYPSIREVLKQQ